MHAKERSILAVTSLLILYAYFCDQKLGFFRLVSLPDSKFGAGKESCSVFPDSCRVLSDPSFSISTKDADHLHKERLHKHPNSFQNKPNLMKKLGPFFSFYKSTEKL